MACVDLTTLPSYKRTWLYDSLPKLFSQAGRVGAASHGEEPFYRGLKEAVMHAAVLYGQEDMVAHSAPSADQLRWRTRYTPRADSDRARVTKEINDTRHQQLMAILTAPQPVVLSRHRRLMKRSRTHKDGSGPYWFTRPSRRESFAAAIILSAATVDDFTCLLVRGDVTRRQMALFLLRTKKLAFEVASRIERALGTHAALVQEKKSPAPAPDPAAEKLAAFWRAIDAEELWCSTSVVEPIAAATQDGTFADLWRAGLIDHILIDKLLRAGLVDTNYLVELNLSICPQVVRIDESEVIPPQAMPAPNQLDTTGELSLLLILAALEGEAVLA